MGFSTGVSLRVRISACVEKNSFLALSEGRKLLYRGTNFLLIEQVASISNLNIREQKGRGLNNSENRNIILYRTGQKFSCQKRRSYAHSKLSRLRGNNLKAGIALKPGIRNQSPLRGTARAISAEEVKNSFKKKTKLCQTDRINR